MCRTSIVLSGLGIGFCLMVACDGGLTGGVDVPIGNPNVTIQEGDVIVNVDQTQSNDQGVDVDRQTDQDTDVDQAENVVQRHGDGDGDNGDRDDEDGDGDDDDDGDENGDDGDDEDDDDDGDDDEDCGGECEDNERCDDGICVPVECVEDGDCDDGERGASERVDVPKALAHLKRSLLPSPRYGHPSQWAPWVYYGRPADGHE